MWVRRPTPAKAGAMWVRRPTPAKAGAMCDERPADRTRIHLARLRRLPRPSRCELAPPPGSHWLARPERRRQIDAAQDPHGPAAAVVGNRARARSADLDLGQLRRQLSASPPDRLHA